MFEVCPVCKSPVVDSKQCGQCQLVFAKYQENLRFKEKFDSLNKDGDASPVRFRLLLQDGQKVRLVSYPLAGLLAFIAMVTPLRHLFLYFFVWAHEFGHALMSWLSGIKATPLSFGPFGGMTFNQGMEKSSVVFICFFFLMFMLFRYSRKTGYLAIGYLSACLALLAAIFTLIVPVSKSEELIIFAGPGGEFILGTLLVSAFYYDFPLKMHWEGFFRWPSLCLGLFTVMTSTQNWINVLRFKSLNRMGANFSEEIGDFNRLMNDYNWSYFKFTRIYLGLCTLCWLCILAHYLFFAFLYKGRVRSKPFN